MTSPALRTVNLTKTYSGGPALLDASLAIVPGEFVAVLGPSGSGKSTLFRCITRLTEPDAGEVFIGDKALHNLQGEALANARKDIGVVFQQFNLIRRRTALENVLAGRLGSAPLWRVATDIFSAADIALASDSLDAVGLSNKRHQRADTLSGGQQQRVAIARALAQQSHVLLADEPVASLDPETAASVLSLMQSLTRTNGLAILCTLHQPQYAQAYADRTLHMREGRIVSG